MLPVPAEMLTSPNRQIQVDVQTGGLEIRYRNKSIVRAVACGPRLAGAAEAPPSKPSFRRSAVRQTWRPVLGKSASIENRYRQVVARYEDRELVVRAYDDGVAFRYTLLGRGAADVLSEETAFTLEPGMFWALYREQFHTSHEGPYVRTAELSPNTLIDLPLLHQSQAAAAITEAALRNYPSALLRREGDRLRIELPARLDDAKVAARVDLPFSTPWRVVMLADEAGKLIESNLIANLNEPSRIADTGWIQPGKTTWSWWNGHAGEPVTPPPALDFATMKRYVDFCACYHIRSHSIVSEGDEYPWYQQTEKGFTPTADTDVTKPRPAIDLPRLVDYARQQNIRLRAWVHWQALDPKLDEAFALYEKWGIEGLMIDFLDRDDQQMVNWMETTLEKAARHHLMIQFHGAPKPTGLSRTWPNLMNHEGVLNLEYSKWTKLCTPEHNVTAAYTRMLAGPMDYHLGGFRNVHPDAFEPRVIAPEVMGTRAHNLAMYVIYENPMPMVADYPSSYESQPGVDLISEVPETWDETRFLAGKPGEWIVLARRRGARWYVAGMTGAAPQEITIPLRALGKRTWSARIWADSAETPLDATAIEVRDEKIETLRFSLGAGGGFVARLE
jgi:alpha-glucosidase